MILEEFACNSLNGNEFSLLTKNNLFLYKCSLFRNSLKILLFVKCRHVYVPPFIFVNFGAFNFFTVAQQICFRFKLIKTR